MKWLKISSPKILRGPLWRPLFAVSALAMACLARVDSYAVPVIENAPPTYAFEMPHFPPKISSVEAMVDDYNKVVTGSWIDKKGQLWFTTTWAGVFKLDGEKFVNYSPSDGLSSNEVYSVYEDQAGVMWFGVKNGVCRYDGAQFSNLALPQDQTALTLTDLSAGHRGVAKNVVSIAQDKQGHMWFGTQAENGSKAGVYRYDGANFTHFLTDRPVKSIVADASGNLWFGNVRYDGHIFASFEQQGFPQKTVLSSLKDHKGNLWFGMPNKVLYRFDGQKFEAINQAQSLNCQNVTSLAQDRKGRIWLGGDGFDNGKLECLYLFDGKRVINTTEKLGPNRFSVMTIIEDKKGNIWFGGRGGNLWRYDGKRLTNFSADLFGC